MTILELSEAEDHRAVLDGISCETYERLLADVGEGHTRLTYDDGKLETESEGGAARSRFGVEED